MRSWSLFAFFIAVLVPFGTAKANSGGLLNVDQGTDHVDGAHAGLLNGTLSALVNADVDLGVDEHLALATADVELDDLLAQVMVEIGAEDPESVLDAAVCIDDVLHAMAILTAEDGNVAAVGALNALALDLDGAAAGNIDLGELFDISDVSLVDGMDVDLLDVIVNMASLWNHHHAIEPATVTLEGDALDLEASIAEVTLDISTVMPPKVMVGPDEIRALARHIEVLAHARLANAELNLDGTGGGLLGAKLVLGNIDVCVFAPYISARADVADDDSGAVMVDADVSRIHMCIGHPTPGSIGEGSDELDQYTEVSPSVIGDIVVWIAGHEVPIARVTARSVASVEAHVDAMVFEGAFPETFPMNLGPTTANLMDDLCANLEINVEALGISLSPIQLQILHSAVMSAFVDGPELSRIVGDDLLENLSLPAIDILGSGVTSIDLDLHGIVDLDDVVDGDHGGLDVDVDGDTDIDVSVDDDVDIGANTDVDVGVDVDMDSDGSDGTVDGDIDADVDVHADEDGVSADVEANVDVEAELGDETGGLGAPSGSTLSLAGGGCTVRGPAPGGSLGGLAPLVVMGLAALVHARRKASRS